MQNEMQNGMHSEMRSINVTVAGRVFPLKIKIEEEDAIRETVLEINELVQKFQLMYVRRDKYDCLAMALLTYAVEVHRLKTNSVESKIADRIDRIDLFLTKLLKK
jgi:Cell division protein ZapA